MAEAVKAGIVFFRTASDGILTSDVVPPQYIISVDDTAKKVNLYRRQQEIAQSAASSGGEVGVQQLVETFEAKASKRTGFHISGRLNWRARCKDIFPRKGEASATKCGPTCRYAWICKQQTVAPSSKGWSSETSCSKGWRTKDTAKDTSKIITEGRDFCTSCTRSSKSCGLRSWCSGKGWTCKEEGSPDKRARSCACGIIGCGLLGACSKSCTTKGSAERSKSSNCRVTQKDASSNIKVTGAKAEVSP